MAHQKEQALGFSYVLVFISRNSKWFLVLTVHESNDESRLLMKLNKIHSDYERQMKDMAEEIKKFSLEADELKAEFEGEQNSFHTPMDSELKELKEEFKYSCQPNGNDQIPTQ